MNDSLFTNGLDYFLISSAVTIILGLIFVNVVRVVMNRFNKRHSDRYTKNQYMFQTVRAIVWLIVATVLIRQIKPLSSLGDTILGATSIIARAVGIAAQATFGNYIAGFFMAVHQPFKVGDIIYIKERDISGTVKEINFRHTVLVTQEQTEIIIPNTFMNTAIIEDMSNANYSRLITLNVAGDTDIAALQKLINRLLKKEELVNKEKEAKLTIKELNKDGFVIQFPIYTDSLRDFVLAKDSVLPKLYKELKKNKIKLY